MNDTLLHPAPSRGIIMASDPKTKRVRKGEPNDMELGQKIRQLRHRAGLTQEQLAERTNVSPQAVSKWENSAAMPDVTALPVLAGVFGVSIDELFDLGADEKLNRIENRMEMEDELPGDLFWEYEETLRNQLDSHPDRRRILSLLAQLYHHRMESDARKVSRYAREALRLAPEVKDCQWLLSMAEGHAVWDWNFANHTRAVDLYRELIELKPEATMSHLCLMDNLIADHRATEARECLEAYRKLPGARPQLIPVYEAAIALARFDEPAAEEAMKRGLSEFGEDGAFLFEAAQYCARRCDYERAVAFYEASYAAEADKKPRYCDALEGIAVIHEIRGDWEKAAAARDRILDNMLNEWGLDPESAAVREAEAEKNRVLKKAGR